MATFEDGSYSCMAGIALIGKVLAGRCCMKYTRAAVGNGLIPEDASPKTMAQPPGYVMDGKISSVSNPAGGECQVTVQINSSDVETGFYVTGIMLYAQDPDEGEVPYTYLVLENEPEWIRPSRSAVGKLATFELVAAVGDVDRVTATIDPDSIMTRADVEQIVAGATVRMEVKIPETGWKSGADECVEGTLCIDIPQDAITVDMVPVVSILPQYMEAAKKCGLGTTARTLDGKLRFYADREPDTELSAMLTLFRASSGISGNWGGAGTGGYVLPAATAATLGGVKVGSGVDVEPDGTISVDTPGLLDDAVAADGEVEEMLDDVFNRDGNTGE